MQATETAACKAFLRRVLRRWVCFKRSQALPKLWAGCAAVVSQKIVIGVAGDFFEELLRDWAKTPLSGDVMKEIDHADKEMTSEAQ
jgi:hypothetical protein